MTKPLAPHPQHCWGCSNKDCEFYEQRGYLSISSEERDTGIRVSEMTPAEFTNRKGCASHSSQPVPEVSAVDRFNRAMISGQTISKEVDVGISFSAQELTKRDAAIRKAERERVLDELVKKVDAGMPSVSADRFRAGLKTAYGNVYLWIESLRQQEEQR